MEMINSGITSLKMVSKSEAGSNKTPTSPHVNVWDQEDVETDYSSFQEEELLNTQSEAGYRTVLIVKLKDDLDIMISPLLLETLQRYEAPPIAINSENRKFKIS